MKPIRNVLLVLCIAMVFCFMGTPAISAEPAGSADIIVIGGGAAGLTAGLQAAELGASVILLEKQPVLGGSTIISGGALAFAGTDFQEERGVKDSNELLYKDLMAVGQNKNDPALVKAYVDNQLETYLWLKKAGVQFAQLTIASGMSVRRAHQVSPPQVIKVLSDLAKAKGVKILMETPAKRLLTNSDGRVTGVVGEVRGKEAVFEAKKGVILASGGFGLNKELLEKFVPPMAKARAIVGPGSTGDGLQMAWARGADIKDMPYIKGTFGYHPQSKSTKERAHIYYHGAIIVNKEGKRFVNESLSYKLLGDAALDQPDAVGYCVWDMKVQDAAKGDALAPVDALRQRKELFEANTLAELAAKMGVPPAALEATVKAYNESVEKGADPQFGRKSLTATFGKLVKIDKPPFFAYPATAVILGTYGGILIDGQARVLDVYGKPIRGLYAAGEVTGGVHGAAYMTGTAFGKAVIFGRIAAKSVLADK